MHHTQHRVSIHCMTLLSKAYSLRLKSTQGLKAWPGLLVWDSWTIFISMKRSFMIFISFSFFVNIIAPALHNGFESPWSHILDALHVSDFGLKCLLHADVMSFLTYWCDKYIITSFDSMLRKTPQITEAENSRGDVTSVMTVGNIAFMQTANKQIATHKGCDIKIHNSGSTTSKCRFTAIRCYCLIWLTFHCIGGVTAACQVSEGLPLRFIAQQSLRWCGSILF